MPGTVSTSAGMAHSTSPSVSALSISRSPMSVRDGTTNGALTGRADGGAEPDEPEPPEPPLDGSDPLRGAVTMGPAGAGDASGDRVGAGVAPGVRVGAGVAVGRSVGVGTGTWRTDGSGPMDGTGGSVTTGPKVGSGVGRGVGAGVGSGVGVGFGVGFGVGAGVGAGVGGAVTVIVTVTVFDGRSRSTPPGIR